MRELFHEGDRIGEFEIVGRLKAGGMATLFLGRRHGAAGVSRPVAIKVIHPHLAEDESIVRMFIDEARISSHIRHGNVVYVETFGETDGVYYMVMEYVDGCSLQEVLRTLQQRGEQLPPELAAHIALEAAAGLHAAHETTDEDGQPLGIVHRDVSPSNVLLTRDGRVKLIDFGIAKARNRLNSTRSGANLKGKVRYMSPEQAWGRGDAIDRRTDVYALGVVLWELLAVRTLFRGDDDLAVLELVRHPVIPPVREHHPDVTQALEAVIARATAKDPDHRLPTAAELRRELMQAVPHAVTITAEPVIQLVARVRETLGVSEAIDRKATTPLRNTPLSLPRAISPAAFTPAAPQQNPESSIRNAAGEIQLGVRHRSRPWLAIAGGIAVAAAIAVVVVTRTRGGGDTTPEAATVRMPVMSASPPAPASAPDPSSDEGSNASDPSSDDGSSTSRPARPAKVVRKPPAKRASPSTVKAVEADGVLLADEPVQPKTKTKPKRDDAVKVDGTVLAK